LSGWYRAEKSHIPFSFGQGTDGMKQQRNVDKRGHRCRAGCVLLEDLWRHNQFQAQWATIRGRRNRYTLEDRLQSPPN
jgi:hypothetical protein